MTLAPPIIDGESDLYFVSNSCNTPNITQINYDNPIHIGRAIHIGGPEDHNFYVRFNVGELPKDVNGKTIPTTYYLVVKPKDNLSYSKLPYKLRLELKPPNYKVINTLILYNPSRFKSKYGLNTTSESKMMDDLTLLAQHSRVNGIIVQLDQFPAVTTAYADWDAHRLDVANANVVSDAIRVAMRQYMLDTGQYITDNGYVVIVGDDDQIPFRRVSIGPGLQTAATGLE